MSKESAREDTTASIEQHLVQYRRHTASTEEFFTERMLSEIGWVEGHIRDLKRAVEAGTVPSADNLVASASRVHAYALKVDLTRERRQMLDSILDATEPTA